MLWHNPRDDCMAVWLMDGTEVRVRGAAIPAPGAGWILAGAGDFNRDWMQDMAWFDPRRRRVTITLMTGTELLEQGPEIPAPPGADWIVGDAADCNGDGMTDLLWLGTAPLRTEIRLMRGTVPIEQGPALAGPAGP